MITTCIIWKVAWSKRNWVRTTPTSTTTLSSTTAHNHLKRLTADPDVVNPTLTWSFVEFHPPEELIWDKETQTHRHQPNTRTPAND